MNYKENDIIRLDENYANCAEWCNKNGYYIQEIEADKKGRRFKIAKYVLTDTQKKEIRKNELLELLSKSDYVVTKLAEMQITNNADFSVELANYQEIIASRQKWRDEINELELHTNT